MPAGGFGRRSRPAAAELWVAVAAAVVGFLMGPQVADRVTPLLVWLTQGAGGAAVEGARSQGLASDTLASAFVVPGRPVPDRPADVRSASPAWGQGGGSVPLARTAPVAPPPGGSDGPPQGQPLAQRARPAAVPSGRAVRVVVFHSHTSEMYRRPGFEPSRPDQYHRFGSLETGVVRVGRVLAESLNALGVPALHITTVHDYPDHAAAYRRSEQTVRSVLARYPQVMLLLDVHRDAPQERRDMVTSVRGEDAARVALVVALGDDPASGEPENLLLARRLLEHAERRFPGLMRRIITVPGRRYNQHLHPGLLVVEVGAFDTWEEDALRTARLLALAVADLVQEMAQ
ncbi:MAG TPA: stage II sporulation protein P, partial [Limnochordales bacterium]